GMSGGMSGGMYPMPPIMDRFGLGLPMGHTAIGSRPGLFQDENPPRKSAEQKMPEGSWKCNNINYPFRVKCNRQNCGAEKPSESNNSPVAHASEEGDQVCFKLLQYTNVYLPLAETYLDVFNYKTKTSKYKSRRIYQRKKLQESCWQQDKAIRRFQNRV
ncbi:hypothetical protein MKW98_000771, partial [Papaver atlanticum]